MTVSSKHTFVEYVIAGVTKGPEVGAQTKKKWGPRMVGPDGWGARRVVIPENGKPSISRFFFLSRAAKKNRSFFSLGGSCGIVATGRGHGPPKLCVWASFCVSLDGPREREKKARKLWAVPKWKTRGGGPGKRGPGRGIPRGRVIGGGLGKTTQIERFLGVKPRFRHKSFLKMFSFSFFSHFSVVFCKKCWMKSFSDETFFFG